MITEEKFAECLKLDRLGFIHCDDYEYDGFIYKKLISDAVVYIHFKLLNNSFWGINSIICYDNIEKLIFQLTEKYKIKTNNGVYRPTTIIPTKLTPKVESALEKNRQAQEIHLKPENVQQVADMVYEYLTEVYQPFWEKYSSLQVVNDEIIKGVHDDNITDYIPFFASFKKIIIMKLCGNPNYESYMNWIYGALKERNEQGESTDYYQAIVELKEILETERIKEYF